jgi:LPXTG-motif cell wall-anchored protein
MKKILSVLAIALLFLGFSTSASAASENDIITALNNAGVPAVYVTQAENYLKANDVTAAEADQIIASIKRAAVIAAGVTDPSKLTQEQLQAILSEVTAAATVLGITLNLADGVVTFADADNKIVAQFSLSGNEVKQTGSSYTYLVSGLALLVASVGSVFFIKRKQVLA